MSPNTILTIKTQKVGEENIMAAIISGSRPDTMCRKSVMSAQIVMSADLFFSVLMLLPDENMDIFRVYL